MSNGTMNKLVGLVLGVAGGLLLVLEFSCLINSESLYEKRPGGILWMFSVPASSQIWDKVILGAGLALVVSSYYMVSREAHKDSLKNLRIESNWHRHDGTPFNPAENAQESTLEGDINVRGNIQLTPEQMAEMARAAARTNKKKKPVPAGGVEGGDDDDEEGA